MMITYTELDQLAVKIFEQNKKAGWWDDLDRCIFEVLQLVSTEIAEATEGERKNLMDDHLPDRKMGEVELADALIRMLDLAGRYGWALCNGTIQHYLLSTGDGSIGKQHFAINMALCKLGSGIFFNHHHDQIEKLYASVVTTILYVADRNNYNIIGALKEKLEYNKTRKDHKRENRSKEHGKKF